MFCAGTTCERARDFKTRAPTAVSNVRSLIFKLRRAGLGGSTKTASMIFWALSSVAIASPRAVAKVAVDSTTAKPPFSHYGEGFLLHLIGSRPL
jgi:hypothetical protein